MKKNIGIISCFLSILIFGNLIYNPAIAQTASLLPNAVQQFFDSSGNPLSSGQVYFYNVGTSTFKSVYTDSTAATPYTNPITLNAGGKPPGSSGIYGIGLYRQLVKDRNGNTIWDAVTSPTGSGGSTPTLVGDGNLVGTILPWSGLQAPNQYVFAYGQEISRTTYPDFYTAVTQQLNVICSASSNTLTGISDTSQINIGSPVELSLCVNAGTTVVSKTTSTVTLSNPSSVSINAVATFFPYGNGNGTTTFNVPDLRGYAVAGRDNMGGSPAGRLTSTYFNSPGLGAIGGSQSETLLQANLPNVTLTTTIAAGQGAHTHSLLTAANGGGGSSATISTTGSLGNVTGSSTLPQMTGTTPLSGSNLSFSIVQPTITINYIIKITPDTSTSIATGVYSIGGMTGVISCGTGILCTGNIISFNGNVLAGGSTGSLQYRNSDGSFGGSANAIFISPNNLTLGAAGTSFLFDIYGSISGYLRQTVPSVTGNPVILWGNSSGTPVVTASSPLAINTTTGNVTCSTCVTGTSGAITANTTTTSGFTNGQIVYSNGSTVQAANTTGSLGSVVLSNSPTLVTPTIGAATGTSLSLTGSITGSSLTLTNSISGSLATAPFAYGLLSYSDTNTFSAFQTSVNSYAQSIWQNTSSGSTASTDIVVSNNLGTATTYYGNFGINSSGFTGSGSLNKANATYLTATTGDLVLGTTTSNAMHFLTNSATTDAITISTSNVATLNSPILVTPTIGVATGTSLALGGASIGSNALAVTGTANISGIAYPSSAISGGILYFNSTSSISSSNLLTANQLMIGGGAGAAPTTIACATTTTVVHGGTPPTCSQIVAGDITTNTITNSNLSQAGAATLKGNPTTSSANVQDFTIQGLTNLASPSATLDYIPIYDHASGAIKNVTPGAIAGSVVAGVASVNSLVGSLTLNANSGLNIVSTGTTITITPDIATVANFEAGTSQKLLDANVVFTPETTTTYGTTTAFDFSTFINTKVTLTGNITTMNCSNMKQGQAGTIAYIQDGTGSRTAAFNTGTCSTVLRFAGAAYPTLTTSASAIDYLSYSCRSSTQCIAALSKGYNP